jgi:hypothetical protein
MMSKNWRVLAGIGLLLTTASIALHWRKNIVQSPVLAQKRDPRPVPTTFPLPTPALQGTVRGQLEPFRQTKQDLRESVLSHPLPKIMLVFSVAHEQTEVELPEEAVKSIETCWRFELAHYYKKEITPTEDPQEKHRDTLNLAVAISHLDSDLQAITIQTPTEKRKISNDEAGEILKFIGDSAKSIVAEAKRN